MALIDDLYALISSPIRMIGFIIPDVVVEEVHRDVVAVTDHPVERGAAVSDHAFMLPRRLEMRCGWSNSTAGFEGYADLVYQELLALQAMRQPFNVFTGKRAYSNMLIETLEAPTDERTESALVVTVGLREILIVDTASTALPSKSRQASPQKTGSVVNAGTKQLQTGPTGFVIGGA